MALRFSARNFLMPASPIRKLVPLAIAAEARGVNVLTLNIGQPDIPTPVPFMESIRNYHNRVLGYGPSQGLPEYQRAVSNYYRRRGIQFAPEEIIGTTGGSEALFFSLMAIADAGDEVIVIEPFYTNYNGVGFEVGVNLRPVAASPADGYRLPASDVLEGAVNERTRAILICSPNNPTGTILNKSELERIADLAEKHDLWVLSDEVYREFAYDGEPLSVMHIPRLVNRTILLDSVSKRYAACGARVGSLACKNRELLNLVLRFGQSRLCPPTIGQIGAIAAYNMDDSYFELVREEYRARRDTVLAGIRSIPGITCTTPAGAFYLMATLPVANADDFCQWMLTDFSYHGETVMLAPGAGFYATPGMGLSEVRIAYVLEKEKCARAIELIGVALDQYTSKRNG